MLQVFHVNKIITPERELIGFTVILLPEVSYNEFHLTCLISTFEDHAVLVWGKNVDFINYH